MLLFCNVFQAGEASKRSHGLAKPSRHFRLNRLRRGPPSDHVHGGEIRLIWVMLFALIWET